MQLPCSPLCISHINVITYVLIGYSKATKLRTTNHRFRACPSFRIIPGFWCIMECILLYIGSIKYSLCYGIKAARSSLLFEQK
ncbi:hypothetical protein V1512DRAFT_266334 [Lipomyces arxii]|uniref:uncharacterized protein n=1 Tax=Lipomyces arxii TaxID=56418 RepID=UPI0034CD9859